jgi:hypothetical protein
MGIFPYLFLCAPDPTDKSNSTIAPSELFQQNPIDPTGNGGFNINCSNPLLSAQEQSIICSSAQIGVDPTLRQRQYRAAQRRRRARGRKGLVPPPEKANGAVVSTAPCRLLVHSKA